MTKGEMTRVTLALYQIAVVEEKVNDVMVWDAIGPNGIKVVSDLKIAMRELALVVLNDLDHSIQLWHQTIGDEA